MFDNLCINLNSKWTFELLSYANILPRCPNLKSIFLKINFSSICCDVINERMQCPISNIFVPKLSWKNIPLILGNSKKSILNFWSNWSLSMCCVTYYTLNMTRLCQAIPVYGGEVFTKYQVGLYHIFRKVESISGNFSKYDWQFRFRWSRADFSIILYPMNKLWEIENTLWFVLFFSLPLLKEKKISSAIQQQVLTFCADVYNLKCLCTW